MQPAATADAARIEKLRSRLDRFYNHYAPAKVAEVDSTLVVWKGREDEMFDYLEKKYGSEAEAVAYYEEGRNLDPLDYHSRLAHFYKRHDPTKIPDVDKILQTWSGREDQMFSQLEKKYRVAIPEPKSLDYKARLINFYKQFAPEKIGDVERTLEAWSGKEEEMFAELHRNYASPVFTDPNRKRLIEFYRKYAPEKLGEIDNALEVWKGRETEMFSALERKYLKAKTQEAAPLSYAERLAAFYEKYAPDKLKDVEYNLESWKGKEEQMFTELYRKYGVAEEEGGQASPKQQPATPFSDDGGDATATSTAAADTTEPVTIAPPRQCSPREKLIAFYAKHAPEKLDSVDDALNMWRGREDKMFDALSKKYELSVSTPPPEAPVERLARARLLAFFEKHAPEKIPEVGKILVIWRGREDEMYQTLATKYGVSLDEVLRCASMPVIDTQTPAEVRAGEADSGAARLGIVTGGGSAENMLNAAPSGGSLDALASSSLQPTSSSNISGRGRLLWWITGCRSLINRDTVGSGLSDPYGLVLYNGREVFRTPTVDNDLNPNWTKENGQCMIHLTGGKDPVIIMRFMDKDVGSDDFLGEARVTLSKLPSQGEYSFHLTARVNEKDPFIISRKDALGTVTAKWTFAADASQSDFSGASQRDRSRSMASAVGNGDVAPGLRKIDPNSQSALKQRVTAFFARYMPERIGMLPEVLSTHQGRELELLEVLSVRLGPEPDPEEFRSRIEKMFFTYKRSTMVEAKAIATDAAGREDFVLRSLVKECGPEPGAMYSVLPPTVAAPNPPNDRQRIRLLRWFMLRCPKRVKEVDYYLVRFAGRESILFRLLAETLGPEPSDEPRQDTVRSKFMSTPAIQMYFTQRSPPGFLNWIWETEDRSTRNFDLSASRGKSEYFRFRERLKNFYQFYNPIKVAEVNETLARWKGREELLFEALVHKYGSEPPREVNPRTEPSVFDEKIHPHSATGKKSAATPREVLQSFYALHNPSKIPEIEKTLERFDGREEVMFHLLHMKYGVNPLLAPKQPAADAATAEELAWMPPHLIERRVAQSAAGDQQQSYSPSGASQLAAEGTETRFV